MAKGKEPSAFDQVRMLTDQIRELLVKIENAVDHVRSEGDPTQDASD